MVRLRIAIVTLAALAAGRAGTALAQGCAMCGSSFEPNDPTTHAFNTSVLFLMLAPYTIFFAAAACVVFLYRRGVLGGRRATVIPLARGRLRVPPTDPKEVPS
jgi:hypothetical protein